MVDQLIDSREAVRSGIGKSEKVVNVPAPISNNAQKIIGDFYRGAKPGEVLNILAELPHIPLQELPDLPSLNTEVPSQYSEELGPTETRVISGPEKISVLKNVLYCVPTERIEHAGDPRGDVMTFAPALTLVDSNGDARTFTGDVTVGRKDENRMVIPDARVSRHQFTLSTLGHKRGEYSVINNNPTNETRVAPILPFTGTKTLGESELLVVGDTAKDKVNLTIGAEEYALEGIGQKWQLVDMKGNQHLLTHDKESGSLTTVIDSLKITAVPTGMGENTVVFIKDLGGDAKNVVTVKPKSAQEHIATLPSPISNVRKEAPVVKPVDRVLPPEELSIGEWNKTYQAAIRLEEAGLFDEYGIEAPQLFLEEQQADSAEVSNLPRTLHLIGRDTRINQGVYPGQNPREIIVVDDTKEGSKLKEAYEELLGDYRFDEKGKATDEDILKLIFAYTQQKMPRSKEKMMQVIEQSGVKPDELLPLDAFINKGGVCRQQTLFSGYLIEKLISDGYLKGDVSVDRNSIPNRGGHAWTRYTTSDGQVYILDVTQRFFGKLQDVDTRIQWFYRRPGER